MPPAKLVTIIHTRTEKSGIVMKHLKEMNRCYYSLGGRAFKKMLQAEAFSSQIMLAMRPVTLSRRNEKNLALSV